MKYLGAVAQRLTEAGRSRGLNHKLLNIHVIIRMFAAIDDIHHRHGQRIDAGTAIQISDMCIQWQAGIGGRRLRRRQGHRQNGVGSQLRLILGAVQLQHYLIQGLLIRRIMPQQGLSDLGVHILNSLQYTLTQVTGRVFVPQLQGLSGAGGGAGRCAGRAHYAAV